MTKGKERAGAYARALEQALSRVRGKPVVLSPRDWALVSDWHARRVPLALVCEALEAAAKRGEARGSSPPASLAYVANSVEEAWRVVRSGRAHPMTERVDLLPLSEARKQWLAASLREGDISPLRKLLASLIERLDSGEPPATLDRELDRELASVVPPALREDAEEGAETDLAPFRANMGGHVFATTRERAVADRLRRVVGLPRLALTDHGG